MENFSPEGIVIDNLSLKYTHTQEQVILLIDEVFHFGQMRQIYISQTA